jgi:ABC-type glycerol-3-phosphate transport system substrate-binding protein
MTDIKEILKEIDIYDIIDFYGEEAIFNEIPSWEIVDYYNHDDLLEEMGYDPKYCFEDYDDFIALAEIEVEPDIISEYDLSTMNEKDIFNRFFELLSKNKLTYQEWDKFLSEHE